MEPLKPFFLNGKKRNMVVTYLCQNIALSLLAEAESAKPIKTACLAHENKLLKTIGPDEAGPIFQMRDTLLKLARMMTACQDVNTLAQIERFVHDLTENRVLIIDEKVYNATPGVIKPTDLKRSN